jgi:hypothetical protein
MHKSKKQTSEKGSVPSRNVSIMNVLLNGIKAMEAESYLGLEVYFENRDMGEDPPCPKTREDMVVPRQAWEDLVDLIGEGVRIDPDQDYDAERREHYRHVAQYHKKLKVGSWLVRHPLPLKTWAPSLSEKEVDDQDGGFGAVLYPVGRAWENHIDYDVERRRHYQHVALYHTPLKAGSVLVKHPLPLKAWSPPLWEKDMDDQDGGFDTVFLADWMTRRPDQGKRRASVK